MFVSESPVTFPPLSWRSVTGRSLSGSKCLTQSKGNYRATSGELHFPPWAAYSLGHLPASRRESAARRLQPRTCRPRATLSSSSCKSPKRVHVLIFGPLNVHAPTSCLFPPGRLLWPWPGSGRDSGRRCQPPSPDLPQEALPAASPGCPRMRMAGLLRTECQPRADPRT